MFNNVLNNPTLSGFTLNRLHTDKNSNERPVEYPDGWECVAFPLNPNDPDEVPASFHRDEGYGLAAGYMKWHGGYAQRGVQLRKGQRYLAKATFLVNMSFHEHPETPPSADELKHIMWRFIFNAGGNQIESDWTATTQGRFGIQEETLFVVEPSADITLDFGLFFESFHPTTAGEIHIKSIELLEVPSDYGTPVMIGNPNRSNAPKPTTPTTKHQPTEVKPESVPVSTTTPAGSISGLLDAMTDDDIDVIATGFRAASQSGGFDATISAGFARFADVLDRSKAGR